MTQTHVAPNTQKMKPSVLLLSAIVGVTACHKADPQPSTAASTTGATTTAAMPQVPSTLHELTVNSIDGKPVALSTFSGKVLLVVNTASQCGYTPQYAGLQALHAKYASRGFSVLGFPSNDFGGQEPGTATEIVTFCRTKYSVDFPLFEKVKTKGGDRSPLYALLSDSKGAPKWNFHKYLVDKKGKPVAAWPSSEKPESAEITAAIEAQLTLP